jgi:hypothetical protein
LFVDGYRCSIRDPFIRAGTRSDIARLCFIKILLSLLRLTNAESVTSGINRDPPEDVVIVSVEIKTAFQQSRGVPRQEVLDVGPVSDLVFGDHLLHNKASFSGGQYDFNLQSPPPATGPQKMQISHFTIVSMLTLIADAVVALEHAGICSLAIRGSGSSAESN